MSKRWVTVALAFTALAPWLIAIPGGNVVSVLAHAIALVAAFHGAGLALSRVAGIRVHPLIAIQLGIATLVGLTGIASALHVDGTATQMVLVYGFAAVHTGTLLIRFTELRTRLASADATLPIWIVPAILLGVLAIVHVLGAAGDLGARPFDDDGHVLAQLQRLRDTGTLSDPIGFPLISQLGGQVTLGGLATLGGDVHLVRVLEAIAFVLAIALACSRVRPHDRTAGLWILILVVAASAYAFAAVDPSACWTAVGLILALHALLSERTPEAPPRAFLPIGVVAGALIALRFEIAPIAAIAVIVACWRVDRRRTGAVVAGMLVVVVPYLISRIVGWASVPDAARGLIAPHHGSVVISLAIFVGIVAAGIPTVIAIVRDRSLRWLAIACVVAIAGIASQLTGDLPYAGRFLWPIVFALGLVIVTEVARIKALATAGLVLSLLAIVLVDDARTAPTRLRWPRRYSDLVTNIEYLRHVDQTPISDVYAPLLRRVPASATVAIWVTSPERIDYSDHRIIDLRTPRAAALRIYRPEPHTSRLAQLLAALDADYLLVELDDRRVQRIQNEPGYRGRCPDRQPACLDDLEAIAAQHDVVAQVAGVALIKLR